MDAANVGLAVVEGLDKSLRCCRVQVESGDRIGLLRRDSFPDEKVRLGMV